MANNASPIVFFGALRRPTWIVEVISRAAECIDLKLSDNIARQVIQKPVQYSASFDAALAVCDQHDLSLGLVEQILLHLCIATADIVRYEITIALDDALQ